MQARLELETDGTYYGTQLKINGVPAHNCTGISFEIGDGGLATAVVHLEHVPMKFSATLSEMDVVS